MTEPPGGVPGPFELDPAASALIETYLDRLASRLGVPTVGARRLLADAADHIHSDVAARCAAGVDPLQAARLALAAFGEAEDVAAAARPTAILVSTGWLFSALGAIAIGLSGLLAAAMGAVWGRAFVAGDPAGLTYSAQRCSEYLALAPGATDCRTAALADHYAEVVDQRVVVGLFGVVLLIGYLFWRRRGGVAPSRLLLGGAAVVSFGIAGIGQLVTGATARALDQGMAGAWLAGAVVALLFAVGLAPVLWTGLRRPL